MLRRVGWFFLTISIPINIGLKLENFRKLLYLQQKKKKTQRTECINHSPVSPFSLTTLKPAVRNCESVSVRPYQKRKDLSTKACPAAIVRLLSLCHRHITLDIFVKNATVTPIRAVPDLLSQTFHLLLAVVQLTYGLWMAAKSVIYHVEDVVSRVSNNTQTIFWQLLH